MRPHRGYAVATGREVPLLPAGTLLMAARASLLMLFAAAGAFLAAVVWRLFDPAGAPGIRTFH